MRKLGRWVTDYRNGLTFIGVVLVLVLGAAFIHGVQAGDRAQRNERAAVRTSETIANNARRRVDLLTGQIADLERQAEANGSRMGELLANIDALAEQVRQLGGRPVVTAQPPSTSTTASTVPPSPASPPTTTAPRPSAPTTTSTTAPTTPTTTCTTTPVVSICPPRR